jgi:chromosome segregation ATPase
MSFTVEEFHDLVRLLEQHPEWRAELRRLVLSEELLSLPDLVRELAHAQQRTEERLEAVSVRLEQLAEAQRRTEERLEAVSAQLEQLVQAQHRTETEIRLLALAQSDTAERLKRATDQLAAMAGRELERQYRERAASYFGGFLRRIRVVDHQALGLKLDEAQDAGLITRQERNEILRLDVVAQGRLDAEETYLAVEVSATVDATDVRRAAERAELLAKATGERVIAAVAGNEFAGDVAEEAARRKVVCFLDGRLVAPA